MEVRYESISAVALSCMVGLAMEWPAAKLIAQTETPSSTFKAVLSVQPRIARAFSEDSKAVSFDFRVTNVSDKPQNVQAETWIVLIDGREFAGSGTMFFNSPGPVDGFTVLAPHTSYEFVRGLQLPIDLPQARDYRIQWKSKAFLSNEVVVHGYKVSHA